MFMVACGGDILYTCKNHVRIGLIRMLDAHTTDQKPDPTIQVSRVTQTVRQVAIHHERLEEEP